MAKITWPDRTDIKAALGATYEWAAAIANEVKTSVNALYDKTTPNTWYVNTNGSDSNVGSANFPFETIQAAHDAAVSDDTIHIQDLYFNSGDVTIAKSLTIIGVVGYVSNQWTVVGGTWTIGGAGTITLLFENLRVQMDIDRLNVANTVKIDCSDCSYRLGDLNDPNKVFVNLKNCSGEIPSGSALGQLTIDSGSILSGSGSFTILGAVYIYNSTYDGNLTLEHDLHLYNATVNGDVSGVRNLNKFNSVITGTETVSGTTTIETQAQPTPNTWYVNTSGSDSDKGSLEFPFETIQAAHDIASNRDIIIFQNAFYSSSANVNISKTLIFNGVGSPNDAIPQTFISGNWSLTNNASLIFENMSINAVFSHDATTFPLTVKNCTFNCQGLPDRKTSISLYHSIWNLNNGVDVKNAIFYNSHITDNALTLLVGSAVTLYSSYIGGNVSAGIDSTTESILIDSSIKGNLNITGSFTKINSVITGDTTVSGTTTDEVQDDTTKLSKTLAADQVVVSNVEFPKVAIGVSTFLNTLDVAGGMAVGFGYAGLSTAPTDGLLVEGNAGFGTTSPQAIVDIKTAENKNIIFFEATAGNNGIPVGSTGLGASFTLTRPSDGVGLNSQFIINTFDTGFSARKDYIFFSDGVQVFKVRENGSAEIKGAFIQNELSADPSDPAEGQSVTWQSDGTGSGDDGDIMMKITAGGTTKTATIVDFSTI